MIDHVCIPVRDHDASASFYTSILAPLGLQPLPEHAGGYGGQDRYPFFWLVPSDDQLPNREFHFAFTAPSRQAVDEFSALAEGRGAEILHQPRVWPEYHPGYYGCFVRDPDGNNIEAVHHTFETD